MVPSGEPPIRVRGKSSPCRLLLRQVCVGKHTALQLSCWDLRVACGRQKGITCASGKADRSVVMLSPGAGSALDPPLWIVPNSVVISRAVMASQKPVTSDEDELLRV